MRKLLFVLAVSYIGFGLASCSKKDAVVTPASSELVPQMPDETRPGWTQIRLDSRQILPWDQITNTSRLQVVGISYSFSPNGSAYTLAINVAYFKIGNLASVNMWVRQSGTNYWLHSETPPETGPSNLDILTFTNIPIPEGTSPIFEFAAQGAPNLAHNLTTYYRVPISIVTSRPGNDGVPIVDTSAFDY